MATNSRWNHSRNKSIAKIQFQFLRISPSYELANRILNEGLSGSAQLVELIDGLYRPERGELSQKELLEVVRSFMKVIELRTIFGDLNTISFDDWWKSVGGWYYGYEQAEQAIRVITSFAQNHSNIDEQSLLAAFRDFSEMRQSEGNPKSLIVSIPIGMTKKKILKQIGALIDEHKVSSLKNESNHNKFVLKRFRNDALLDAYFVLSSWAILEEPLQLWRFGVMVKISPSNSRGLSFDSVPTSKNVDQRNTLAVLTHRALTQAQYIAENAAHGIFPSREKCRLPRFDQAAINARLDMIKSKNL